MKRTLITLFLLTGCSQIYGMDPPVGCDEEDVDGDGFLAEACLGAGAPLADCDDTNADVFPGATEVCNLIDDDCDGLHDEGVATALYARDCDDDGVGANVGLAEACDPMFLDAPSCEGTVGTWVSDTGDCDDTNAAVFPGATELCNLVDDDCDGRLDEEVETAAYAPDCDEDGTGANTGPIVEVCDPALLEAPVCDGAPGVWVAGAGDCDDRDATRQTSCDECGSIDMLFVVDNTSSMFTAQMRLTSQLPRIIEALAMGDSDLDGTPDTEPVADLHLGVVTADMGSRGFTYSSCAEPNFGDDGLLVTPLAGTTSECAGAYPTFLQYDPSSTPPPDIAALSADAVCRATQGTGGCFFEQPLEAALKALTPSSSLLRFYPGELGHGDFANAGFLRDDSVLAVTVLSDEDDCSVVDSDMLDPSSGAYSDWHPNVRCAFNSGGLQPILRYTSGLRALRDAPDLVFGVIAGVPLDAVVTSPTIADYDNILLDSRLVPALDSSGKINDRLVPSCTSSDSMVHGTPPVRLLQSGRSLGERSVTTVLESVCAPAYDVFAAALVDRVLAARARRCF